VERLREEIARQQEMAQMQAQLQQKDQQIAAQMGEIEKRAGYENYLIGELQKRTAGGKA
jgi:uncharacterized protein (DUF3084 family)